MLLKWCVFTIGPMGAREVDCKRLSALQNSTAYDVVNRRYDYLVEHVNAMRIFPYLVSGGLVDMGFRQFLDGERTDNDKMMALLQELIRSPTETWFDRFTNALSKVSQYEVIVGELLGDFTELLTEKLANPPPDNVPMRRGLRLKSSSSEPMLVIKVASSVSGVDDVMKKAMDDAQAGQKTALIELQKASCRVQEAKKGKVYAEAEKNALEEREQKTLKELTVANEKLREAEMHKQAHVKECQSYKDKTEEKQRRMEMENMQHMEDLAQLRLQMETAMERAQEMEGERSALEEKVASLQAEVEKGRRQSETEVAILEQQLSEAINMQQLGKELQLGQKEELGHLRSQLESSLTKSTTLEEELAEARRANETLEQGTRRLKEELEEAMANTDKLEAVHRQAVNKVGEVTAELAKVQAKLTEAQSMSSELQDRYRHKENEFIQYKRIHANCDVTNPLKPGDQLLPQPSLNGRGRNQLDDELVAVEGQLASESDLPSLHHQGRYEGHVWRQHGVRQASRVVKGKK